MTSPTRKRGVDALSLYELCVTDAPRLIRFLEALHGRRPRVLREDFCGSGAVARAWPGLIAGGKSIAVDRDPVALGRARARGVRTVKADVRRCSAKADIISATNFPLGYFHERDELVAYLKHARRCLNPRGVFVADMYGGRDALRPLKQRVKCNAPDGSRVMYTWEQREADAATGIVLDTLSFEVNSGGRTRVLKDAFVYRWRLWSVPELRDALDDAGFARVEVHDRMGGAIDGDGRLHVRPLSPGEPLDENWLIYIVGRR